MQLSGFPQPCNGSYSLASRCPFHSFTNLVVESPSLSPSTSPAGMWISHATHDINPPRSRNTLLKLLFENPFHDLKSLFLSLSSNVSGLTHLRLGCLESFKCRCYSVDCELTRRSAHECAEEPMEVHEQSLDWDQVAIGELGRERNLLPTHSGWLCASTAAVRPILPFALR